MSTTNPQFFEISATGYSIIEPRDQHTENPSEQSVSNIIAFNERGRDSINYNNVQLVVDGLGGIDKKNRMTSNPAETIRISKLIPVITYDDITAGPLLQTGSQFPI
jgi:hypothetical protein